MWLLPPLARSTSAPLPQLMAGLMHYHPYWQTSINRSWEIDRGIILCLRVLEPITQYGVRIRTNDDHCNFEILFNVFRPSIASNDHPLSGLRIDRGRPPSLR